MGQSCCADKCAAEPLISMRPFAVTNCSAWLVPEKSSPKASSPVILNSATIPYCNLLSSPPYELLALAGAGKVLPKDNLFIVNHNIFSVDTTIVILNSATISYCNLLSSSPYTPAHKTQPPVFPLLQ